MIYKDNQCSHFDYFGHSSVEPLDIHGLVSSNNSLAFFASIHGFIKYERIFK